MSRSSASYHHGDLRAALLLAASELLEQHGQDALSLREVARVAGVSHNAPYHHFKDKEALLSALAAAGQDQLLAEQLAAANSVGGPVEAVVSVGMAYVRFGVKRPQLFALIFDPKYCSEVQIQESVAINEELLARLSAQLCPQLPSEQLATVAASVWSTAHGSAQLVSGGHFTEEQASSSLRLMATLLHEADPSYGSTRR